MFEIPLFEVIMNSGKDSCLCPDIASGCAVKHFVKVTF